MAAHHELFGGKLHVYKRDNSRFWQCSTFLVGRNHRISTKEEGFAQARDIAEDWYLWPEGQATRGRVKKWKTFKFAAAAFRKEYEALTAGERNLEYVKGHWDRLRVHLLPFFGSKMLSQVTPGLVQEYQNSSRDLPRNGRTGEPCARPQHIASRDCDTAPCIEGG